MYTTSPFALVTHQAGRGGHRVPTADFLKNIETMEREGLVQNAARMGRYLLDGLKDLEQKHPIVGRTAPDLGTG